MQFENLRILEGKSLLWDDITQHYKKNIDAEDYIVMHNLDHEVLRRLSSTKPFFSEYYIVELHLSKINNKLYNQLVKYTQSKYIMFIFVCTSKDDYDMIGNIARRGFNGYKISYNFWSGYVKSRLDFQVSCNLENIYKALSGRFELTDIIIDILKKTEGKCSLRQVKYFIGSRDRMNLDLLWFSILRKDEKARKDVFKYLEEYRYGYSFIDTALKEKYKDLLKFYADFNNGLLNEINIREYKKETHLSEWVLKLYIEVFNKTSFDEILLIGKMIECSTLNSTAKMFELVGRLYSRNSLEIKVV